ncbi:uncharacterized protein LOC133913056 isoform X2 [Phragmites australis]|uniref:uncharacterized protein LOC133913056 isoform X2 n=1 Tax=Phragmites australis TaxID=29695 RepID=UPI002D79C93E|nr:uncharacterized protein LOC133913056 isoform X2 [Phragmites australis]
MATSPTGSSSSAPNASSAAAAEATDGPVLSVVSKRLRALRKKYNRILQMEESLAAGKTLNREQEEVLRSKAVVTASIDELERLRAPLAAALAEELSSRPAPAPAAAAAASSSSSDGSDSSIQDLLSLVYFGSLFNVKPQSEFVATMVARTHERSCCITYDYVTDDAADLLVETDLDAVSALAALAASRPAAAVGVSHRDALQACAHHARLWLRRADEPIYPDSGITYARVRAKLDRIMASDYYTAQPEMRATVDVAAAVGSYGAGGVQAQESMVVSPEAPAVEESMVVEEHKDEKEESQATEIYTDHPSPLVDAQHDDTALVNPMDEVPSAEAEQERFDAYVEDSEQKDEQFIPRRSYQNQRGGGRGSGRRGYPNGRGGRGGRGGGYQNGRGGGYQNGRGGGSGYYYDTGYYQQRNYNNRGRGGRSGGNSYYNHGVGPQGRGRVELGANA